MNELKKQIDNDLFNIKGPLFHLLNSIDGIYMLDKDKRLIFVNEMITKRSGFPEKWLLGKCLFEIIKPEDVEYVKEKLDATLRGENVPPYELTYYAADGTEKWVEINTTGILDESQHVSGILVISRDITARKKNEEELQRYRTHLEHLVDEKTTELKTFNEQLKYKLELEDISSSISASFINLPIEKTDAQINYALKRIVEFLKAGRSYLFLLYNNGKKMYKTHEWCAEGVEPFIETQKNIAVEKFRHFTDKIKNLEVLYLSDTNKLPIEARHERRVCKVQHIKSMINIPMAYQGRAIGLVGLDYPHTKNELDVNTLFFLESVARSFTNLIVRRNTMLALEESEKKYRTIFDTAHDSIFLLNNYRFTECNDYTLRLFNCRRKDIIGRSLADFSPETQPDGSFSREKSMEYINKVLFGKPQFFEWQNRTLDGNIIDTEVSLGGFWCADKHMVIAIVRDITDRKKAERELQISTTSLNDYNSALKILLSQRDADKHELETTIQKNTRELVLPYIDKLKRRNLNHEQLIYLDILEANLKNIISPFSRKLTASSIHFTPTEIRIANLIKEGRTMKEIAMVLGISINSVNLHRQNIRNKLNLNKKKISLKTYLMSITI